MVTHSYSTVQSPNIITMPTSLTLADEGTARTRIAFWDVAKSDGKVSAALCLYCRKEKKKVWNVGAKNNNSQSWREITLWEVNSSLAATVLAVPNNVSLHVSKSHPAEMNRQHSSPVAVLKSEETWSQTDSRIFKTSVSPSLWKVFFLFFFK